MFKLVFFIPEAQKETVKNALFALGAGTLGSYGSCCWECEGTGQFMPLDGSDPFLGETDKLERLKEFPGGDAGPRRSDQRVYPDPERASSL